MQTTFQFSSPRNSYPLFVQTPWFGRAEVLGEVLRLLAEHRCVTIVGARGVGKTRLAVAAAESLAPGRTERLECDPVGAPDRLEPSPETACLVLESQVFDASLGQRIETLLNERPQLRVICTSWSWPGYHFGVTLTLEALSREAATQLFTERAGRASPRWNGEQHEIEALCAQLDDLPGPIELAATLIGSVALRVMREHLEAGQPLETLLTPMQRQRFPWGFQALEALEAQLPAEDWRVLAALCIPEAGFSLEAAAVLTDLPGDGFELLDALAKLVDWFGLRIDHHHELGYRMPRNLRAHLRYRLEHRQDYAVIFERWLAHALAAVRAASPGVPGYVIESERVGVDRADLERLLRLCMSERRFELALGLCAGLRAQLVQWGLAAQAQSWLSTMLREGHWNEAQRLNLFLCLCYLLSWRGAFDDLGRLAVEGIAVARRTGDEIAELRFLEYLAQFHAARGGHDSSSEVQRRTAELALAAGDERGQAVVALYDGQLELEQGRYGEAQHHFETAKNLAARQNDPVLLAQTRLSLADAALSLGDPLLAARYGLEALQTGERLHHTTTLRLGLHRVALAATALGATALAERCRDPAALERMTELLEGVRTLVGGGGVRPPPLTGRDELLARRLIQGETNKQIARRLGVTEHAIRNRLSGLYARYSCHSRAELVHFLLEQRLVTLETGEP